MLLLAFKHLMPCSVLIKTGTQNRVTCIDVSKVFESIGQNVCEALPGLHVYSGCDTLSAFAGKGKLAANRALAKSTEFQNTFKQLDMEWDLPDDVYRRLEKFTCVLYSRTTGTSDINKLHYRLFCLKRGDVDSSQLPPCSDTLHKHCLRANHQADVWRRSLQNHPTIPSPVGRGWCMEVNTLTIDWMNGDPAPKSVIKLLSCQCRRSCKLPSSSFFLNGLNCTDICSLRDCSNRAEDEADVEDIEDGSDFDDDYEKDV